MTPYRMILFCARYCDSAVILEKTCVKFCTCDEICKIQKFYDNSYILTYLLTHSMVQDII
jgi:hypothetical protein